MFAPPVRPVRVFACLFIFLLLALSAIACSPASTPAPLAVRAPQLAAPTSAPAATSAPQPTRPSFANAAPTNGANPSTDGQFVPSLPPDRLIIKNAQIAMIVNDVDIGVARMTGIASDVGGYLFASHTYFEGTRKVAQVTISVPVDRYEEALNLVRKIADKIESDTASSSDVSDQYVDLNSRLRNLQATADRIRSFLDKATTVDEALKINAQLNDVNAQIEDVKGKLNAMNARSSFSNITADMREIVPTPTPTNTPTLAPTATPTSTPTHAAWQPGQTIDAAVSVQGSILRALANFLIWFGILVLPYVVVFAGLLYAVSWLARKLSPPTPRTPPT